MSNIPMKRLVVGEGEDAFEVVDAHAVHFDGPQELTPEQQAQAKANMGIADEHRFAYNFTTLSSELVWSPEDAEALHYITANWNKVPMSIYIQGYPVIGIDLNDRYMRVLQNDRNLYSFRWQVEGHSMRLAAHAMVKLLGENEIKSLMPAAKVKQTDSGALITITDKDGTTEVTVVNGRDGMVTDADIAKIIAEVQATANQQTPLFANSIEECTDTSKVYVLPDGYIYGYMSKSGALFTNQIIHAIDADGTRFNGGKGYQTGYVFNTKLELIANDNGVVTGFIPYKTSDGVLRVAGYTTDPESVNNGTDTASYEYVVFYDSEFNAIAQQRNRICYYTKEDGAPYEENSGLGKGVYEYTLDFDYLKTKTEWWTSEIIDKAAYVRFSFYKPALKAVTVTIGEEIVFGSEKIWQSTGHKFVPADHEERIIPLEESAENHEARIRTLEMYGSDSTSAEDIPAYIKAEADAVMNRLIEKQGNRNFTMIAMSDFHYSGMGDNKDNLIRACKAISYMTNRIHIDAVATLGDNLPYGSAYDDTLRATANRWSEEINEILAVTQKPGIVDFRTPGNHDRWGTPEQYMPDNAIYSFISGYNRQCDYVDIPGGWAYRDFPGHRLRVIVLNTAETEGKGRFEIYSGFHMSTKQYNWLIDTLDMSDKADAFEWQMVILSHHRADDYQAFATNTESYFLPNILHAYSTGGSFTGVNAEDGTTISCNFAGKNSAKLIGQIHGHHHSYIYGTLGLGRTYNELAGQTDVMAVSTPTSSFGTGSGHNDDNNGNYYDSVKDTAEETAFCVYSIDLDNHIIHAIHYGNGVDREVSY